MTQLHFNYKDIFRALRLGFSAKKMAMMVWGFILAMVGYIVLSYVAFLASGWTMAEIWDLYRILPVPEVLAWYGWVIWAIGVIYALCVILVTGTAIAKVTFEQLKGDDFFQMTKAFNFAKKEAKSILFSPAMVILFILSIAIAGLILSLIGAIPYFGEIFTGLMILPAFAASLFIVYLFIILVFTILYAPAVVATSKTDTFDTLFEVFSIINDQPARIIWYSIIVAFLAKLGTIIFAAFSRVAVNVSTNILSVFMGNKIVDVIYNAASSFKLTIPYWCPEIGARLTEMLMNGLVGSSIFMPTAYVSSNFAILIATILVTIAYYLVILLVLSFGMTIWFSGTTVTYLVIMKKKDDRNLLEEKEIDFSTAEQTAASEPPKP